jgi:hypothetical protein
MATGRISVAPGQVISSAGWGNIVWDQSVQCFASMADVANQYPAPHVGSVVFTEDTASLWVYIGNAWQPLIGALDPNVYTNATPIDNYPIGTSLISLSSAAGSAGGWPEGTTGTVVTFKPTATRGVQYFYRNTSALPARIYYRSMQQGGTQSAWQVINPLVATGQVSIAFNASNFQSQTVTLPTGRFATAPIPNVSTNNPVTIPAVTSISATSMVVAIRTRDGSNITATVIAYYNVMEGV